MYTLWLAPMVVGLRSGEPHYFVRREGMIRTCGSVEKLRIPEDAEDDTRLVQLLYKSLFPTLSRMRCRPGDGKLGKRGAVIWPHDSDRVNGR